jgi:protein PhnA
VSVETEIQGRSGNQCEFCATAGELVVLPVHPRTGDVAENCVHLCPTCSGQVTGEVPMDPNHWYCLQQSAWSPEPAVQVLAWRLLHRLSAQAWAIDLADQIYMEDDTRAWAEQLEAPVETAANNPVDSNGTVLNEGDSVTLIKDLVVKGANFTAKRGTLVKNIRVGDDPTHVEGKVSKMSIMLKTCFLKRA